MRFETPPGHQLQIDGEVVRVYLFVATLGHARRGFVAAFRHERQIAWFQGLERAFRHFGGVPAEVLFDNANPLDPVTREVVFNDRLHAFARYWDFHPRGLCAVLEGRCASRGALPLTSALFGAKDQR